MEQGIITCRIKSKVTDDRSNPKFVRAEHEPYGDSYKPSESSFA